MAEKTNGPKKQRKRKQRRPRPFIENPDCYSIEEWCRRNGISIQLFYKRPELMPKTFWLGARRLISREANADWRAQRTAASEAAE